MCLPLILRFNKCDLSVLKVNNIYIKFILKLRMLKLPIDIKFKNCKTIYNNILCDLIY